MKGRKEEWIAIGIIIAIAFLCCWCYINYKKEADLENLFKEIKEAYDEKSYEEAIQLSYQLPEPYDDYYLDFISKRIEIEKWSGTEEQLYQWIDDYFRRFHFGEVHLPEKYSDYCLWSSVGDTQISFNDHKEEIENMLHWYPEFYEIFEKYYSRFYSLWLNNMNLFLNKSGESVVEIKVADILKNDSDMMELYSDTLLEVENLEIKYSIEDEYIHIVTCFKEDMQLDLSTYSEEISLKDVYDIDSKSVIYITDEVAKNNYEFYSSHISSWKVAQNLESSLDEISRGTEKDGLSQTAYLLISILDNVYDDIDLDIQNTSYYKNEREIRDEIFPK